MPRGYPEECHVFHFTSPALAMCICVSLSGRQAAAKEAPVMIIEEHKVYFSSFLLFLFFHF